MLCTSPHPVVHPIHPSVQSIPLRWCLYCWLPMLHCCCIFHNELFLCRSLSIIHYPLSIIIVGFLILCCTVVAYFTINYSSVAHYPFLHPHPLLSIHQRCTLKYKLVYREKKKINQRITLCFCTRISFQLLNFVPPLCSSPSPACLEEAAL